MPDGDDGDHRNEELVEEAMELLERFPTLLHTAKFIENAGRVGLFLGAGASVEFNIPTASGLTERIRASLTRERLETMNANMMDPERRVPEPVLDEFLAVMEEPHMNYEDWVAWLSRQSNRGPRDRRRAYGLLFTQVVEAATILLTEQHHVSPAPMEATVGFYRGLAHLAKGCAPLWIFSLNHDLCVEMIAADHDLPVAAGFTDEHTLGVRGFTGTPLKLGYEKAEREAYPADSGFLDDGTPGINLLKLHGSLDTFAWTDDRHYVRLLPPEASAKGYIELARMLNEELIATVHGEPIKPWGEVGFNDEDGELQLLRRTILAGDRRDKQAGDLNIPPGTFERFQNEIRSLDTLVVVGYSFGDEHVNDVLRDWHDGRGDRRIILVSPSATEVGTPGFDKTRILPVNMPATDFFDLVGGNALSPFEQLIKTMRRHPSGYDVLVEFGGAPPREELEGDVENPNDGG